MSRSIAERHALWTLHTIDTHGPIGRFELANELRYIRPRDLTQDQALAIMSRAIHRLLERHEIRHIGSNGHHAHTYDLTAEGVAELHAGRRRIAALNQTIEYTVIPRPRTRPRRRRHEEATR